MRWDLSPLFGSADDARAALATSLERATAFEQAWRGAMPEMTGPRLAEALLELGDIDNLLSRVHSYASLRKAVDVTNEENRDLSAAVEQGVVQVLNALRFFELEWLVLEDDRAAQLAATPEVAADRHYLEVAPPVPAAHAVRARGARAGRARSRCGQRLAGVVRPDDIDDRGAVRRRRRRGAAHGRPAAGVRARPATRRPAGRAGDAVRGARPAHTGAGAMLRLAGRRPAGARPPALLRDADHPDAPAQRARCLGGRRDAGRGRGELPDRPAVVPSQGRRARARQTRAARSVRPRGQRPRRRVRRGPHDRDDRVRRVRAARAAGGRRPLRGASDRRRAAGRQARRRVLLAGRRGRRSLHHDELHRPHERRADDGPRAGPRHALRARPRRADAALRAHRAGAGGGALDVRRVRHVRPPAGRRDGRRDTAGAGRGPGRGRVRHGVPADRDGALRAAGLRDARPCRPRSRPTGSRRCGWRRTGATTATRWR